MSPYGRAHCVMPNCEEPADFVQIDGSSYPICEKHRKLIAPPSPRGNALERLVTDLLIAILITISLLFTIGAWAIGVYQLLEWIFT